MSVEKVAVLGGGLMGSGIAESVARAGIEVTIRDVDEAAVAGAGTRIAASLYRAVSGGKLTSEDAEEMRQRIILTHDFDQIADADLVIEAVPENAELKANILAQVAGLVSEDALIASNTSSIPIAQLAAGLPRPDRVLGLHFFSPVPVMPLVEVVTALDTSEETLETAKGFADAVRQELAKRTEHAVGVKSIAAYRTGLDLAGDRPADAEVTAAAWRFLRAPGRLADQTLQRFLIWCANDLGKPIQFHVGYGDSDVDLHRCNPLLLTPLLRNLSVPVMLLHNYPYHREAGYLAQVFPQVYVDAGLATQGLGHRAPALLAEALELTPYGKFLYSSDAFGLPELYYLGAALFRRALDEFLRARSEERRVGKECQ